MINITVVASVSRPARLADVLDNFEQQTQPATILLVMNGAASETEVPCDPRIAALRAWGDAPLGGTPARPRNAGLEFVRMSGGGMVAFWDDDDHYGPGYLAEVVDALRDHRRRVVGKVVRYVEFDDGMRLFTRKQGHAFLGGTMAGWAEELPPVPDLPCHEDHEWCRLLERDGFELVTLSGAHYVYNRKSGQHAWGATLTQMLHCYGPAFAAGNYLPRATAQDVGCEMVESLLARPADPSLFDLFEDQCSQT